MGSSRAATPWQVLCRRLPEKSVVMRADIVLRGKPLSDVRFERDGHSCLMAAFGNAFASRARLLNVHKFQQ